MLQLQLRSLRVYNMQQKGCEIFIGLDNLSILNLACLFYVVYSVLCWTNGCFNFYLKFVTCICLVRFIWIVDKYGIILLIFLGKRCICFKNQKLTDARRVSNKLAYVYMQPRTHEHLYDVLGITLFAYARSAQVLFPLMHQPYHSHIFRRKTYF